MGWKRGEMKPRRDRSGGQGNKPRREAQGGGEEDTSHKGKALRAPGTSGWLFRLKRVCEAPKDAVVREEGDLCAASLSLLGGAFL